LWLSFPSLPISFSPLHLPLSTVAARVVRVRTLDCPCRYEAGREAALLCVLVVVVVGGKMAADEWEWGVKH
jgi:hypothetical protein